MAWGRTGQAGMGVGPGGQVVGNGPQGIQRIEDDSTEDSDDDDSTDFEPLEGWGAPGPVDPNWVAGN